MCTVISQRGQLTDVTEGSRKKYIMLQVFSFLIVIEMYIHIYNILLINKETNIKAVGLTQCF